MIDLGSSPSCTVETDVLGSRACLHQTQAVSRPARLLAPSQGQSKQDEKYERSTPTRSGDCGSNQTTARSAGATHGTSGISFKPHCATSEPLHSLKRSWRNPRRSTSTCPSRASFAAIRCSSSRAFSTCDCRKQSRLSLRLGLLGLGRNERPTSIPEPGLIKTACERGHAGGTEKANNASG